MIERAVTPWQKARHEFKRRVVEICEGDASFLLEKESPTYKKFEEFCLKKLIHCRELDPAEFIAFVVFVKFSRINDAAQKYSELVERNIKAPFLQKKARTVRNKILDCFATIPSLKEEAKQILNHVER